MQMDFLYFNIPLSHSCIIWLLRLKLILDEISWQHFFLLIAMPFILFILKHNNWAKIEIFEKWPNWLGFAFKIITLFEIPSSDFAGIMYFDSKKNIITFYNDQELQYFYASPNASVFEFFVKDLCFSNGECAFTGFLAYNLIDLDYPLLYIPALFLKISCQTLCCSLSGVLLLLFNQSCS